MQRVILLHKVLEFLAHLVITETYTQDLMWIPGRLQTIKQDQPSSRLQAGNRTNKRLFYSLFGSREIDFAQFRGKTV